METRVDSETAGANDEVFALMPLQVNKVDVTPDQIELMSAEALDEAVSRLGNALSIATEAGYHVLGGLLYRVYMEQLYADYGMESFEEYCENRLGFKKRKGLYLIAIWKKFVVEIELPRSEYEDVEWSKLKELVPVIDKENVQQWLTFARNSTVEEIRRQVRKELNLDDGYGEETIRFSINLFPGEKEIVEQALDAAKKMVPGEEGKEVREGRLLECICADFLSGVKMHEE